MDAGFCVWNVKMLYDLIRIALICFALVCFAWLCLGLPCHTTNMILFWKRVDFMGSEIWIFSNSVVRILCTCSQSHIHSHCIFFSYILLSILMITIASIVLQRSRHLNYQTLWLFNVDCCLLEWYTMH